MASLKGKITLILCCGVILLCIGFAIQMQRPKSVSAERPTGLITREKGAVNCDDFSKEDWAKENWLQFFQRCRDKKVPKEKVLQILKSNKFDVVIERTHHSVRLLSADKGCLNKALVFRLHFTNDFIVRYEFHYGLIAVD